MFYFGTFHCCQNWADSVGLWLDDLVELLAFGPMVCSEDTPFPLFLWHSAEWALQRSSSLSAQAQGNSSRYLGVATVEKLAELTAV